MRIKTRPCRRIMAGLALLVIAGTSGLAAEDRVRFEVYGGLAFMNPRDLNLLSRAEEQYNYILFQERLLGWSGYFTNDFPQISRALSGGLRIRYGLSRRIDVSVDVEAFQRAEELSVKGTFSYSPGWSLIQTKAYDPFRLGLKAAAVMGGLQYKIPAGRSTELEIGVAAGWAWAEFDFRSTWTFAVDLTENGENISSSEDGSTLEGDGRGNAPAVKLMLRLNRALGRRLGFFVETAATYCRVGSLTGDGREKWLSLPEETTWNGIWAIKKEEVRMPYDSATVFVPTNCWEGRAAGQRDRDFILDISSLRLLAGIYLKF
jgi:hypothetical protein